MSSFTGFRSYWIYNLIRYVHFNSNKFNIIDGLARKSTYLKKWNDEMINRRDSLLFMKIDEMFSGKQDKLIRLMSYYYIKNPKFYVTEIFDDNFSTFKNYEWEVNHLKEVLEKDFMFICLWSVSKNIPLNAIFKTRKMNVLFKMYEKKKISIHSLICLDEAFRFIDRIDVSKLNIVEEEKFKTYKKLIDNYSQIIYKYLDFDCKEYLKQTYKNLMEN